MTYGAVLQSSIDGKGIRGRSLILHYSMAAKMLDLKGSLVSCQLQAIILIENAGTSELEKDQNFFLLCLISLIMSLSII